jgi:hypothetical protein
MVLRHYPQVPPSAILEFGGYRLVKPGEWQVYLDSLIRDEYPAYYREYSGNGNISLWRSNACILESLEKYLFSQYGVYIPSDNLFKVYNQSGEGVPPDQLLEAIAAVIEPLGFQVERVIVPDPELREALGDEQRTVGMEQAYLFEGLPGVCMINIKPGESHAFYWERMDARRFHKEQFRMALILRPAVPSPTQTLSAEGSVEGFCQLLHEYLDERDSGKQGELAPLVNQVEALDRCVESQPLQQASFHELVLEQVSALVDLLRDLVKRKAVAGGEEATLIEAGELVRRIYSTRAVLGTG